MPAGRRPCRAVPCRPWSQDARIQHGRASRQGCRWHGAGGHGGRPRDSAGRGGGAGTLCFTGKEFGRACQAGWDDPGRMRWGFVAERHGLPRLLTDPCVWGIGVSPGWDWRIWVGPSDALSSPPAGAYYPAQGVQQFPAGVPTAQVIVSQQPPIPPKRERKTVRSHPPPGTGGGGSHAGGGQCQPQVPAASRMGCGTARQGRGGAAWGHSPRLPPSCGGSARGPGCVVGAGDLGRPGGRRCAESRLPRGGVGVPRLPTAVCSRRCRCSEASNGAYL